MNNGKLGLAFMDGLYKVFGKDKMRIQYIMFVDQINR